ncbi:KR domain-containing protein [Allosalinactinospora lopnorensis]|uniref:KR domain-containing protein n=1 Tax=Allosalinactinospora lopnorensis TaxID=1352348 RepID=UPI00069723A5|nr:KR domain-containing protein [Allosalinactinospora lopnorensis]
MPDAVVDLTVDRPFSSTVEENAWREAFQRSVAAVRACYEDWAAEHSATRLCYLAVTYLGGGMGYHAEDAFEQPLGGIWAGFAKTLHRELPNCYARVVDLGTESVERLPRIVAAELSHRGRTEVGYRDGRRRTLTPRRVPVGRPALHLGTDDTVLISGGGRGIGWQLARELARDFGLRVIVTGREAFPSSAEPWFGLSEPELREYQRGLWSARRDGRSVAEIRREIDRTGKLWELASNVTAAQREGLRIEYLACDFTDRGQVRAVLAQVGGALTGVVHNAGIDTAVRLPKKSDGEILRTVETKIEGFRTLFEEVRESELKFFCNVGSLTGRLGGMVGQMEYAAANEGLARLGLWARRRTRFPVMTLCWPTWDRIGLITNFSASLRYMAPLDVQEGLAKWRRELAAGSDGEVAFVGYLGKGLSPSQAVGFPAVPELPGFDQAYPKIFHLGEVLDHQPNTFLRSVFTVHRDWAPVAADFLVEGAEALPVSVLLENAARAAEWVLPPDGPPLGLSRIEAVVVPLSLLRLRDAEVRLEREVRGEYRGHQWVVEATFRRAGEEGGPEARLRLVHSPPDGHDPPAPTERPDTQVRTWRTGTPALRWRGVVIPSADWHQDPAKRLVAEVRPCADADLWVSPFVPRATVPVAALENILRATTHQGGGLSVSNDPLIVGDIVLHGPQRGDCRITGDPALGVWKAADAASGEPVVTITGLTGPRN